jgi:hypothetical protein
MPEGQAAQHEIELVCDAVETALGSASVGSLGVDLDNTPS